MSETKGVMNIETRLLAIQSELKAPKGQYNSFGKYKYRNCEDILEAVKPLCVKYGAVLSLRDEIVNIGSRYYVKADAILTSIEDPDELIMATAYAREEEDKKGMDGSQVTGASSSYARKYALNGLFCIDDTKDSDSTNTGDTALAKTKAYTYSCDDCGKKIESTIGKNGETISADKVVELSIGKYGHKLCADCMKKESGRKKANA